MSGREETLPNKRAKPPRRSRQHARDALQIALHAALHSHRVGTNRSCPLEKHPGARMEKVERGRIGPDRPEESMQTAAQELHFAFGGCGPCAGFERKWRYGCRTVPSRVVRRGRTLWGIRVLDVRPVTLGMLSLSADPQCAANAVSFGQEDGTGFIGEEPPVPRIAGVSLRFPIDRVLADGVLFNPSTMEHKWALFHHRGQVICVRSWTRKVHVVARCEQHEDHVELTRVQGTFGGADEEPECTTRVLDYLLWSHALDTVYPAPLPIGMEKDPKVAATWCMMMFGNRAWFATPYPVALHEPERPLRTDSLLHIAVAKGHVPAIQECLAAGIPVDLLASDGHAPLHWALACDDPAIMTLLLERGSSVDVRSGEGATPLMSAAERACFQRRLIVGPRGRRERARSARLHRPAPCRRDGASRRAASAAGSRCGAESSSRRAHSTFTG